MKPHEYITRTRAEYVHDIQETLDYEKLSLPALEFLARFLKYSTNLQRYLAHFSKLMLG